MCKAWDDHYKRGVQQGMQEGIQQGMQEGIQQGMQQGMQQGVQIERIQAIENMIKYKVAKETILQDYTEEEYEEAEKAMLVEA